MLVARGLEQATMAAAASSASGLAVIEVVGDPGVGKTALLDDFVGRWETEHGVVVRIDDIDALAQSVAHTLRRLPYPGVRSLLESNRADLLPFADQSVETLMERAGDDRLLLVVDDADRLGAQHVAVLAELARHSNRAQVTIVLTRAGHDPAAPSSWIHDVLPPDRAVIALEPLDLDGSMAMAEGRIGARLTPARRDAVVDGAGNPYLIANSIDTSAGSVTARLDALDELQTAALTALSVLGETRTDGLVAFTGHADADGVIDRLVELRLARRSRRTVAIDHPSIGARVLGRVEPDERRALYDHAADVVARLGGRPSLVADLRLRGVEGPDGAAAEQLRLAAEIAAPIDPARASRYLLAATRRCAADDASSALLHAHLAQILAWAGRLAEADVHVKHASTHVVPAETAVALAEALARATLLDGDTVAAASHLEQMLNATTADEPAHHWAHALRSMVRVLSLDLDGALADSDAVLAADASVPPARVVALCSASLAHVGIGRATVALADADEAVRIADRSPGLHLHRLHPLLFRGLALQALGRTEEAIASTRLARSRGVALGAAWAEPLHHFAESLRHWDGGDWDDALAEITAGLDASDSCGSRCFDLFAHALRALIGVHRGTLDDARRDLAEAQRLVERRGLHFGADWMMLAIALLHEADGAPAEALATLDAVWALAPSGTNHGVAAHLGLELTRLAISDPDGPARIVEIADVLGDGHEGGPIIALRAGAIRAVVESDHERLRALSEQALELGRRLDAALILECAARIAGNPRANADGQAATAIRRALRRGDVSPGTDARPADRDDNARRSREDPWSTLTGTERRIVALVADGMTNKQIAQHTSTSRRTVEAHLRSIYTKLGHPTRTTLAVRAARHSS